MKQEKWRLFVAPTRNDTMRAALDEAYSKASGTHILIYKKGKCPPGYKEMKDENLNLLPTADREWLNDVNLNVIAAFEKRYAAEQERANMQFLERFEKELEIERGKLSGTGGE